MFQELSHPACFTALCGHQTHLTPDVVRIVQKARLGFVRGRICFKPRDPTRDRLPKLDTDFEVFAPFNARLFRRHRMIPGS